MFCSIKESENVRRGEGGGCDEVEDEGEDEGLKKMLLIPFLGILLCVNDELMTINGFKFS